MDSVLKLKIIQSANKISEEMSKIIDAVTEYGVVINNEGDNISMYREMRVVANVCDSKEYLDGVVKMLTKTDKEILEEVEETGRSIEEIMMEEALNRVMKIGDM